MMIIRRSLTAVVALLVISSSAVAKDPALATIVDSSENTKDHAKLLADLGVTVIGRYYGRCRQYKEVVEDGRLVRKPIVTNKRMIDNAGEVDTILGDKRLAILSVYQFYSQASKFDNDRVSRPSTLLDDRPKVDNPKTVADFNDCFRADRPNTIEKDAELDGYAAVTQAGLIGQPKKSAIYFGVDFNLTHERRDNVIKYFRVINKILTDHDYEVGVYGNGSVSDLLYDQKLAKYVWLNASSGHEGSAYTYNIKHWDLLQTKTDTIWVLGKDRSGKPIRAELDTNMQNPASSYIGFWKRKELFTAERDRNIIIHEARQFVCEGSAKVFDDGGREIQRPACTRVHGLTVRTYALNARKDLIGVDCDEDGQPDGWMRVKDISKSRPTYFDKDRYPEKARCTGQ
jgi:hypothetical protein